MKSRISILSAAFFLCSIFYSFQVKAQTDSLYNATATAAPTGTATPAPIYYPGNYLPINNGVVFLAIAGIIIGIVAVKKYKSVKTSV